MPIGSLVDISSWHLAAFSDRRTPRTIHVDLDPIKSASLAQIIKHGATCHGAVTILLMID